MSAPDVRSDSDSGASAVEYGAVLLLVAAVIGALLLVGVPTTVATGTRNAICRIFGGDCPGQASARGGAPPQSECVTEQHIDQESSAQKLIVVGSREEHSTQVDTQADGGLTITTSDETGTGVDVELGLGGRVGGVGWGVSVGGGVLWTGHDQEQLEFADQDQADDYYQRVQRESAELLEEEGFDALDEIEQIGLDVAEDMGIPYTIINADGTDAFVEVDGDVGIDSGDVSGGLGGSLEYEEVRLLGTSESVGADGNATHGDYYSAGNTVTGEIGLGVSYEHVGPRATRDFTSTSGNVVHVEYDDDGDPIRVTSINTTEWHTGEGQSAEVRLDLDESVPGRDAGAGSTHRVSDGDVTVTTTSIEIPADRRDTVADELRGYFEDGFAGRIEGASTIAELAEGDGATTTMQSYDSTTSEDGGPVDLDFVIEWIEWGSTSRSQSMELTDADYRDPVTGAWTPWVTCANAGD